MTLALKLLILLLVTPVVAAAQPTTKVYRIGVLANALATSDGPTFQAFLDALHGLGYVQERNMEIEWRSSEGAPEQLPALASELIRAKVDVILATALLPAQAAVEATKTVPIVFVVLADPVRQRLVHSLARPGGNATGVAAYAPHENANGLLRILKTLLPTLSRLAVMTNPSNRLQRGLLADALSVAAQRASVALERLPARTVADLPAAFAKARRDRADAMYVLPDILTFVHRARIAELAAKNRLPAVYAMRGAVEAGGLLSYGPNSRELFQKAAVYVDRILKGASAGDIPVEQSTKSELIVNLRTARALGLTVPAGLLQQAAQVIE